MKKFSQFAIILTFFSIACFAFSTAAFADDVTEYINEALQYYKDGDYSDAVDSLNYAEQLIQQKKSAGLEAFLPEPIKGWTAETATSQAAGSAMLGGGISAERNYKKGNSSIKIQIMADSPMLQGVMMMMSNPMFATADGGKLERIEKQKAIIKFDPNTKDGELQIVVANRFMVSIDGQDISKKDLKDYAKAIDYNKMAQLP
jgi:tetratricopeptide (TPR) repeat protein